MPAAGLLVESFVSGVFAPTAASKKPLGCPFTVVRLCWPSTGPANRNSLFTAACCNAVTVTSAASVTAPLKITLPLTFVTLLPSVMAAEPRLTSLADWLLVMSMAALIVVASTVGETVIALTIGDLSSDVPTENDCASTASVPSTVTLATELIRNDGDMLMPVPVTT